ncbi:RNase H1/viroplasmin domain-containing protein [Clostridium sp.]|uniref:RNase H1/viroplasmin domain-containing protein n=1 Tax=Clostridium sp. TaxID=1506 RepID=UPI0034A28F3A
MKRGKNNIKNKIVLSWSECEKLVSGVSLVQYKGFKELEEAEIYLGLIEKELTDDEIILMPKLTNEKAKKKNLKIRILNF